MVGVPPRMMFPNTRFMEDLRCDELEPVELVMAFEEEFAIQILNSEAESILTIGMATFTNLNAYGEGSVPAVRVTRERFDMISPDKVVDGARLVSGSIYHSTEKSMQRGAWSDFSPIAVETLVDDPDACNAALARLSSLAWQALEIAIDQLPPIPEVGLYYVDVPHEITWNAF